jgi:hypothetical protein
MGTWQYAHGLSYIVVLIAIVVALVFIGRGRLGAGTNPRNLMPVLPSLLAAHRHNIEPSSILSRSPPR